MVEVGEVIIFFIIMIVHSYNPKRFHRFALLRRDYTREPWLEK